jgi:hypothetical protein
MGDFPICRLWAGTGTTGAAIGTTGASAADTGAHEKHGQQMVQHSLRLVAKKVVTCHDEKPGREKKR